MEPNKIDTKIREKLGSREIKPSEHAWDRLDAMLSVADNKKKKSYSWIYIAASFILFASLGFWFYNQNNSKIITNENNVVTTEKKIDVKTNNQIDTNNRIEKLDKKVIENESVVVDISNAIQKKKESENNKIDKELNVIPNEKKDIIVVVQDKEVKKVENPIETTTANRYITGETLLAAIENRPIEKKEVLNKEVQSKLRVNTSSLLTSVETELDEDHKETTIDKLTRNFKQVKSALANRNYEE